MEKTIVLKTKLCKMENQIAALEGEIYRLECQIDDATKIDNGDVKLTNQTLMDALNKKHEQLSKVLGEYNNLCEQKFYYRSKINAYQQELARKIVMAKKDLKINQHIDLFADVSQVLVLEGKLLDSILEDRFSGRTFDDYVEASRLTSFAIKEARREVAMQNLSNIKSSANISDSTYLKHKHKK